MWSWPFFCLFPVLPDLLLPGLSSASSPPGGTLPAATSCAALAPHVANATHVTAASSHGLAPAALPSAGRLIVDALTQFPHPSWPVPCSSQPPLARLAQVTSSEHASSLAQSFPPLPPPGMVHFASGNEVRSNAFSPVLLASHHALAMFSPVVISPDGEPP